MWYTRMGKMRKYERRNTTEEYRRESQRWRPSTPNQGIPMILPSWCLLLPTFSFLPQLLTIDSFSLSLCYDVHMGGKRSPSPPKQESPCGIIIKYQKVHKRIE